MSGIMGNTVGTTMPRPDWAQTDPKKADYIKNKPDVEKAQKTADAAVKAAENAQATANAALPKTGGAMSGPLSVPAPTEPGHAVSKEYADANFRPSTWLPTPKEIGATRIVELWVNASSSSTFGGHTEQVSLSECMGIFVDYLAKAGSSGYTSSGLIPVADGKSHASFFPSDSGAIFKRSIRADLESVTFGEGYQGGSVDNTLMIPVKIYGVK